MLRSSCALFIVGALLFAAQARSQVTTTKCSSNSPTDMSCTTTGTTATSVTAKINCSSNSPTDLSCTTTTIPPTPTVAQSMVNGYTTGQALRGVVDRIHERHRESRAKEIIALQFRVKALVSDDLYNDTLMTRAEARYDTAAVVRLGSDRINMDNQVGAMFDTLDAMRIHAGLEGLPRRDFHVLSDRLAADSSLALRLDSLAVRRP